MLLKGAPGTGKTILLNSTAMCFGYTLPVHGKRMTIAKDHGVDVSKYTGQNVIDALVDAGAYGYATHNADKVPTDVFFDIAISINDEVTPAATEPGGPASPAPPTTAVGLAKNPAEMESAILHEVRENPGEPPRNRRYIFEPFARPVVTAFIELHNEANRMSSEVADTILSILAEKWVEYRGRIFQSPADGGKLGALRFFDYNPHLDVEGQEMDRALLDRIDVSLYLSAGDISVRYKVLDSKNRQKVGYQNVNDALAMDIYNGLVDPMSKEDLRSLWDAVERIKLGPEVLRWISFFCALPNIPTNKYSGSYWEITGADAKLKGPELIDLSLISYKDAKGGMPPIAPQSSAGAGAELNPWDAIRSINRPLGVRSSESLMRLYKAYKFLRISRDKEKNAPVIDITDGASRASIIREILMLLPYVLDHRVNLGVGTEISGNFLNFFDFIRNYYAPVIIWKDRDVLFKVMVAVNETMQEKEKGGWTGKKTRAKFLEKYAAAVGIQESSAKEMLLGNPLHAALAGLVY